jgi:hypothetical protein
MSPQKSFSDTLKAGLISRTLKPGPLPSGPG